MKDTTWKELFIIAISVIGFLVASMAGLYVHFMEKDITRLETRIETVNTVLHERINRYHDTH